MQEQNLENLPVLVTGASGFIGCYLSQYLHKAGAMVRPLGLVRNDLEARRKHELSEAGMSLAEGDFADPDYAGSATEGIHTVIHLGAAHQETSVPDEYFQRVNADGTRTLLGAAANAGTRRFIYGSSIGVFGSGGPDPFDESSPVRPNNAYGHSKVATEKVVLEFADRLAVTNLRISETYGDGDFRLIKLFRAAARNRMLEIGDGSNLHQPIHVHDLSRCIEQLIHDERSAGQTYIVAGSEPVSTHDMLTMVAAATHPGARVRRVPFAPIRMACVLCETVFGLIGKPPPLHRRRLEFFTKNLTFDTSKLQNETGFHPEIDFATGCRRSAEWYRSNGLIN